MLYVNINLNMAVEIEHKYLVKNDLYRNMSESHSEISQGYLSRDKNRTIRVRIKNDKAFITIKGITEDDRRQEFEYQVPVNDARQLLDLCLPHVISKTRYFVPYEGYLWEVDEFHGDIQGLVIAEIELTTSHHDYALPPFVSQEVTQDPRYYNSNLSEKGLFKF